MPSTLSKISIICTSLLTSACAASDTDTEIVEKFIVDDGKIVRAFDCANLNSSQIREAFGGPDRLLIFSYFASVAGPQLALREEDEAVVERFDEKQRHRWDMDRHLLYSSGECIENGVDTFEFMQSFNGETIARSFLLK